MATDGKDESSPKKQDEIKGERPRMRTSSTGSVRGAFYTGDLPTHSEEVIESHAHGSRRHSMPTEVAAVLKRRHKKRQPSSKSKGEKRSSTTSAPTTVAGAAAAAAGEQQQSKASSTMAELANLVVASLSGSDDSLPPTSPSPVKPKAAGNIPPRKPSTPPRVKQQRQFQQQQQQPQRSLQTIPDSSQYLAKEGNDSPMRKSMQLSESMTNRGPSRYISATESELTFSDASLEGFSLRGMDFLDVDRASTTESSAAAPASVQQAQEISMFSAMAKANYGATDPASTAAPAPTTPKSSTPQTPPKTSPKAAATSVAVAAKEQKGTYTVGESDTDDGSSGSWSTEATQAWGAECIVSWLDPVYWLTTDVKFDENGKPYFDDKAGFTLTSMLRNFLYNPLEPEFTSLQQFSWAIILGILMGFFSAGWKFVIETGLDFVWETVPEFLLEKGFFTELDGAFPLYHYMWIVMAIFGGVLSYIFVKLPLAIPEQNAWIDTVHSRGVIDHRQFGTLWVLSTLGMLSGLSLGPESPLVLLGGMVGSWLGIVCKQSMLQARVLNLTAAGAAVGGFFGFPMAGALFVLEIPHRMGLQYFEALSPAVISSIAAVLCNRLVTGNDVTGYYSYPFLTATLPSAIFTSAIVYGLYGAGIGLFYAKVAKFFKIWVHDLFHAPHDDHGHSEPEPEPKQENGHVAIDDAPTAEATHPLLADKKKAKSKPPPRHGPVERLKSIFCLVVPDEAHRAALAGVVAGIMVGIVGIYVPHTVFWGEAQLQNLINQGQTPLPIFGAGDEPTAGLTALGYCLIDPENEEEVRAGMSIGCAALLTVAKTLVIGLSLGTGIIGGHFWGPLFCGVSAAHLLTHSVRWFEAQTGLTIINSLAEYPTVAVLCVMGAAHVVTFRAHMAIMLILTLTISAFNAEDGGEGVGGDYSAVFPLLVVSCFVSLMTSRHTVFYKAQRCRGDIVAVPEALCEPNQVGRPMVVDYDSDLDDGDGEDGETQRRSEFETDESDLEMAKPKVDPKVRSVESSITPGDIERDFEKQQQRTATKNANDRTVASKLTTPMQPANDVFMQALAQETGQAGQPYKMPLNDTAPVKSTSSTTSDELNDGGVPTLASSRLDELLSRPIDMSNIKPPKRRAHRRTLSAPVANPSNTEQRLESLEREIKRSKGKRGGKLQRVESFGEIEDSQPSLLEQARMRAASSDAETAGRRHKRMPSLPSALPSRRGRRGHSRSNSAASSANSSFDGRDPMGMSAGALSLEDIERSFNAVVNKQSLGLSIDDSAQSQRSTGSNF